MNPGKQAGDAIAEAARQLSGVSDTPRLDAELLMAAALGCARETLLLSRLSEPGPAAFQDMVGRRLAHEPVAYILGRRDFWTVEIQVGPGALIPRPDSETLLDAALDHFGDIGPRRILDLGTGPGSLLLAALAQWPQASGIGIDASPAALDYARRNAGRLGVTERASFRHGDWATGIDERFDLILCNPPYVETGAALSPQVANWEPEAALFAGKDGLDAYRRIAPQIRPHLQACGIACLEIGAGQCKAVASLFQEAGLKVGVRRDLAGVERCLILEVEED